MIMRLTLIIALMLTAAMSQPAPAADGRRVALVIGNAKYPDSDAPLKEPIADMRSMADELKRSGFEVATGENLTREGMQRALDGLYGKVKPGTVALLFFSGYGIQSGRQSFMIPVDGQIWTEGDVRRDGFSLDAVLSEINSRGASVKIAILDASRRNPFERRFRSFSAGLAPVTAPRGTLVMYSAAPSTVVNDAATDHSLFVTELLKEIRVPGLTAEEALNRTRVGVSRASQGDQVPWFSSSLAEEFSFGPESKAAPPPPSLQAEVRPQSAVQKALAPEPKVVAPEPKIVAPEPRIAAVDPKPEPPRPAPVAPPPVAVTPPPAPPPVAVAPPPRPAEDEAERKRVAALANDPAIKELTSLLVGNPNDAAAYYKRGQIYATKCGSIRATSRR
jgi:hypothetical protein